MQVEKFRPPTAQQSRSLKKSQGDLDQGNGRCVSRGVNGGRAPPAHGVRLRAGLPDDHGARPVPDRSVLGWLLHCEGSLKFHEISEI